MATNFDFNPFTGNLDAYKTFSLDDLTNVVENTSTTGDVLQYTGSNWTNVSFSSLTSSFIDGTGVAGRIAYFSDANTLTTSAGFSISGSTITVVNLVSDGNGTRSLGTSSNGFLNDFYSVPSGGTLPNGTGMRLKLTGSKAANDGTCNVGLSGIYNTFCAQEAWKANDTTYQFSNLYQGSKGDEHLYLNYDIGPSSPAGSAGFGAVRVGYYATYGGSPIEHYSRTASTRYVRFEWDTSDNYFLSQFGTVTSFQIEMDTKPKTNNTYHLGSSALKWKDLWLSGNANIAGNLVHTGSNIGFFGVTVAARASAYTVTNVTTDRAYDANSTTLDEVADVLGTLIADLKTYGLLQ